MTPRAAAASSGAAARAAAGPPSTMAVADAMRALGLRVRAGAPRRSHASSDLARLRRTASVDASRSARSARLAR